MGEVRPSSAPVGSSSTRGAVAGLVPMVRALAAVALLAAAVVVLSPPERAAAAGPFVVDTGEDGVDATIDGVCATASGDCTLRAAVQEANASGGLTEVAVDPSVTVLSLDLTGPGGDAEGDLDLVAGTTLRLTGNVVDAVTTTRVDASLLGDRHVEIASGARLELRYVTLSDATTSGDGGAVLNHGELSATTDTDFTGIWSAFEGNSATGFGGAIASTEGSTVELADRSTAGAASSLRFQDNSAGLGGGSISADGATVTMEGSSDGASHDVYVDNGSTPGDGGGILAADDSRIEMGCRTYVRFSTAARGGNVFVGPVTGTGAQLFLSGGGLDAGAADEGGAAYIDEMGDLRVTDDCSAGASIGRSTAVLDGGGVLVAGTLEVRAGAELSISGSGGRDARNGGAVSVRPEAFLGVDGELRIVATEAELDGGGLHIVGSPGAPDSTTDTLSVVNGTLAVTGATAGGNGGAIALDGRSWLNGRLDLDGNSASGDGGGIWVGVGASAFVVQSRLTGNQASEGGGAAVVAGADELTIAHSTVAQNSATDAGGGVVVDGGNSIVYMSTLVDNAPDAVHGQGALDVEYGASLFVRNGARACTGGARSYGFNVADEDSCLTTPTDLADPDRFDDVADLLDPAQRGVYVPRTGHPAIDFADCESSDHVDQLGAARPADGDGDGVAVCDAGAVEAGAMELQRPISGTVFDESTGEGLSGVCVVSLGLDDDDTGAAVTGPDGAYEVRATPGRRLLAFFVPSAGASEPSDCDTVEVAPAPQAEWYRNVPVRFSDSGDPVFPDPDQLQVVDTTDTEVAGIDACLGDEPDGGADAPCPLAPATPPSAPPTTGAPASSGAPSGGAPTDQVGDLGAARGTAGAGRLAFTGAGVALAVGLGAALCLVGALVLRGRRRWMGFAASARRG